MTASAEQVVCEKCSATVDEVCNDRYCRDCHVSLSFEDCVDGTWCARQQLAAGVRSREEILKLYPEAKI